MTINSPCISVCAMDEKTGYCKGCYRTVREVADWLYYTDDEKIQVLAELSDRKKTHPTP